MKHLKNFGWETVYLIVVAVLIIQIIVYYGISNYFQ